MALNRLYFANDSTNVKIGLFIIFVIVIFASFVFLTARISQQQVAASPEGYIDLISFNFDEKLASIPHTSFIFYQEELLEPEDFKRTDFVDKGVPLDHVGRYNPGDYGTYRAVVKLADPKMTYGLSAHSAMYSQRLFIDGKEYSIVGMPGETKETTQPATNYYIVFFEPETEKVEIVIQFANFYHHDFGGILPLSLGTQSNILSMVSLIRQQTSILSGGLLMAFMFFLGIYIFFGNPAFLWFSLISLSSLLRTLVMNEKSIMLLFPEMPWNIVIGLEYISLILLAFSVFMYVNTIFEEILPKNLVLFFTIVSLLYAAMVMTMPPLFYTRFLQWYLVCIAATGLYVSYILIENLVRKKANWHLEHFLLMAGVSIYILLSILNMWIFHTAWQNAFIGFSKMSTVLFIFINFNGFILRFFRLDKKNVALEKANATINELLRSDALTGIANRLYLREYYNKVQAFAIRHHSQLSIVMTDIDHFKVVNDQHGHQVGDQVLIEFANLLKENCREEDLPVRYGGEEFCILLVATDAEQAYYQAERIRSQVEATPIGEQKLKITASFGVATLMENESLDDLLMRADAALYKAKNSGRNRVVAA